LIQLEKKFFIVQILRVVMTSYPTIVASGLKLVRYLIIPGHAFGLSMGD